MKIKFTKETIKKVFTDISSFFKGAASLPNFWTYIALSIFLSVIFFMATFPYEVFIRNQLNELGGDLGTAIYVGDIDFNFTGPSTISSLSLIFDNGAELDLQNINIDLGLYSAAVRKVLKGNLTITNLRYKKDEALLKSIFNSDYNFEFSSFSESPSAGDLSFTLQNVQLEGLTIKGFDIPPVRFTLAKAELKLIKKSLNIRNMQLTGPDISGNIKGEIVIEKFAKNSRLNLNLEVDSDSPLLENYRILLSDVMDRDNKIIITVRGSIANPQVNLPRRTASTFSESPAPEPESVDIPENSEDDDSPE